MARLHVARPLGQTSARAVAVEPKLVRNPEAHGQLVTQLVSLGKLAPQDRDTALWDLRSRLFVLNGPATTKLLHDLAEQHVPNVVHAVAELFRKQHVLDKRSLHVVSVAFGKAIGASAKKGHWRQALQLLEDMEQGQVEVNHIVCGSSVAACAKGGRWKEALRLLSSFEDSRGEPDNSARNAAVSACAAAAEWRPALQLLADMERDSLERDAICFTGAITACGRGGEWRRSLALLNAMGDAKAGETTRTAAIELDNVLCNAAVSACEKGGAWRQALQLLEDMKVSKLFPDTITFNAAISACRQDGEWEQALKLLCGMGESPASVDAISCSAAISACATAGAWPQALQLLEDMEARKLKAGIIVYGTALEACAKCGEWRQALRLVASIRRGRLQMDSQAYCSALAACRTERESALGLLEDMEKSDLEVSVYASKSVINACATAGDIRRAVQLVRRLDAESRRHLIRTVLAPSRRWQEALQLLGESRDNMARDGDPVECRVAISSCAAAGEWTWALHLLHSMADTGLGAETAGCESYVDTITACQMAGAWEQALQLLEPLVAATPDDEATRKMSYLLRDLTLAGSRELSATTAVGADADVLQRLRNHPMEAECNEKFFAAAVSAIQRLNLTDEASPTRGLPTDLFGTFGSRPTVIAERQGLCAVYKPAGWPVLTSYSDPAEHGFDDDHHLVGDEIDDDHHIDNDNDDDDDDDDDDGASSPDQEDKLNRFEDWVSETLGPYCEIAKDPSASHGLLHRLDRSTSGILLMAKTYAAHQLGKLAFAACRVRKEYVTVVEGHFPRDIEVIDDPLLILKSPTWIAKVSEDGEPAITHVKDVAHFIGPKGIPLSLVSVRIRTGKTHQIRVHLQNLGHPVLADYRYGGTKPSWCRGFQLHANLVEIDIGDGPLLVRMPLPKHFHKILRKLTPTDARSQATLEAWRD